MLHKINNWANRSVNIQNRTHQNSHFYTEYYVSKNMNYFNFSSKINASEK